MCFKPDFLSLLIQYYILYTKMLLLGLRLNLCCNILLHCLEPPTLIIKQSGASSRWWEPNDHYTYSLITNTSVLSLVADSFTNGGPHAQWHSRSTWEMGMTVACRRCQSWSNTMAKGRAVSCCAPWKMKYAPALYLELMDSIPENKEEEEEKGRRLRRRFWGRIILVTSLFSLPSHLHLNLSLRFSLHSPQNPASI